MQDSTKNCREKKKKSNNKIVNICPVCYAAIIRAVKKKKKIPLRQEKEKKKQWSWKFKGSVWIRITLK
jgi:hypothetical protein